MEIFRDLEIAIILFLQSLGGWLAEPLRTVSLLGNEEFYLLAMPAFYWCVDAALGIRVAVMLLLSNGLNSFLKAAFHAPRPYWVNTQVQALSSETSFGIPSAHAQNAASVWGLLATELRSGWGKAAMVVLIFVIGFSRMYLGMHFLSDVLVGWLVGGLLLLLFLKVEEPVRRWLSRASLQNIVLASLLSALLIAGLMVLPALALGNWEIPTTWQQNVTAAGQEEALAPLSLDSAFTVSGTWFGMIAGAAWLFLRGGGFDAAGSLVQRLLRFLVGLVGVAVFWFLLGQVFPREADLTSYGLRFLRYTLIGLWVSAAAPLLFRRLGLASGTNGRQKTAFTAEQNPL